MSSARRGLALRVSRLRWSFAPAGPVFLEIDDLSLEPGQVLAVTGPSGSGKSSLLFLLAGLDEVTQGSLAWGGEVLAELGPQGRDAWRRRHLGLVFQDFQLVPELSAVDNVLLPLTFSRWSVPRAERDRASRLLADLGVERSGARAATLSRGEMQRTALARALFGRPAVLVADEPTASLDARNGQEVADRLVAAARQDGTTVVLATHQADLVRAADRSLTLDHGRVVGGAP